MTARPLPVAQSAWLSHSSGVLTVCCSTDVLERESCSERRGKTFAATPWSIQASEDCQRKGSLPFQQWSGKPHWKHSWSCSKLCGLVFCKVCGLSAPVYWGIFSEGCQSPRTLSRYSDMWQMLTQTDFDDIQWSVSVLMHTEGGNAAPECPSEKAMEAGPVSQYTWCDAITRHNFFKKYVFAVAVILNSQRFKLGIKKLDFSVSFLFHLT